MITIALFLFFKVALATYGLLCYQMNFCITFSSSEKSVGILTGSTYGHFDDVNSTESFLVKIWN